MKDLGARFKTIAFLLLALATTPGCQSLSASTTSNSSAKSSPGQLTVTPSTITFGSVPVGTTQTQSATLTNSGGSDLTISQAIVNGSGFAISGLTMPFTLVAGQSVIAHVSFSPPSRGTDSGSISLAFVVSSQGHHGKGHGGALASPTTTSTVTVPVSGTGIMSGQLFATPGTVSLGNVLVGASQSQPVTITNGSDSTVTVSQATVDGAGFSVGGLTLPLSLAPGQSQGFSVSFAPQSAGAVSGSVSITSDATNPSLSIALSAAGVTPGSLVSNPSSLAFGNVQTGTSQTLSLTLTNSGGSAVNISQATATGSGYSVSGLSLPLSLAAGQSKSFSVQFAPQTSGSISGNIAITSDASNTTLNVPLSGSGVMPGTLADSASSLSFGTVLVGNNSSLQETLTNTGGSSLTISQATVSGSGFSISGLTLPATLPAGQSTNFNVTFAPQSSGAASGSVSLASNASNSTLKITLSGTGATPGVLSANSQTLNFGNVLVNGSTTQSETLTNTGGTTITVSQANVSGSEFSVSGLNLPLTLIAGQGFTFGATFAPTTAGSASGTISLSSDASNSTLTISLSGTGTVPGQLSISPTALDFGSVVVGQSGNLTATLSATGSDVTVSSASTTSSEFKLSGVSFPFTIRAGKTTPVTVTFTPQSSGAASGTIAFASTASNSPTNESLTGNGTAPPQHSVGLNWASSTSTDVVGYNVYRSTISGGPFTKINTALNPTTAFVDNSVQAGQTYYYVTTAVDGTGIESAYSNQVKAVIPSP